MHGAVDVEHACTEPCFNAEEHTRIRHDTLHNAAVLNSSPRAPSLCTFCTTPNQKKLGQYGKRK